MIAKFPGGGSFFIRQPTIKIPLKLKGQSGLSSAVGIAAVDNTHTSRCSSEIDSKDVVKSDNKYLRTNHYDLQNRRSLYVWQECVGIGKGRIMCATG